MGVLEGLKTGRLTLVGPVVGALVGPVVGALVGPLVGQLVVPLMGPLVGQGSLSPALCVAHLHKGSSGLVFWMRLFCLQLEASCLQWSFFTYS